MFLFPIVGHEFAGSTYKVDVTQSSGHCLDVRPREGGRSLEMLRASCMAWRGWKWLQMVEDGWRRLVSSSLAEPWMSWQRNHWIRRNSEASEASWEGSSSQLWSPCALHASSWCATFVQHISMVRCQSLPRSKANVLGSDLTMVFGLVIQQAHFWWHSLVLAASDARKQKFNSPAFKLG
jgi:hypothetical protein